MNDKTALRAQAIAHRDKIAAGDEDVEAAADLFFAHVKPKKNAVISCYWPMGREFDSRYLIDDIVKNGFSLCLPVAGKASRVMEFAPWDGKADLVKGEFGIMVPDTEDRIEPDILVVPFLAFDRKGHRLGRGAGHYDATIAELRARRDILAIGLGYAAQAVLFNLPAEAHDQPLDMVITPNGVHDFRA
ncbi:MAG: 5-formyltetrahydrofolate cyclo-ligase [Micavibrio sp.]